MVSRMVNAFVLVNIEGKQVREIAEAMMKIDGVAEVYPVAGEYDIVVVVRVKDNKRLSQVITEHLIHTPGVRHTKTLFALDVFAKVDLPTVYGIE